MRLGELISVPDLGLRVLVGDDALLDRPVRSTYSSDLLDPSRYLDGGELVVTGLVWRREPADSDVFVGNVARSGAVGIAAGTAQFGDVPDDVIEACRRHEVALVAVPEDVSFTSLTEYVLGTAAAERGARLESRLALTRDLLAALAHGDALEAVLARVREQTGASVRVLTAVGRHVVPGAHRLSDDTVAQLVRAFLSAERLPLSLPGGRSVHPVGGALGSRLSTWLLVVDAGDENDEAVVAPAEVASIVRLAQTRLEESRRSTRALADDAVRMVALGRTTQAETTLRLDRAGLDLEAESYAVVVLGFEPDHDGDELRDLCEEIFAEEVGSVVAQPPGGPTIAIVPTSAEDVLVHDLRGVLERIAPGLTPRRLAVGVSDAVPVAGLSGMLEEARHAYRLAAHGEDPTTIVRGKEIDSHVLLLASVPDEVRRLFARRVLGGVLAYDDENGTDLLATLRVFLDCSGSWSRTAQRLHLHVNSVRYRIARIEQLTGRDLSQLPDRVDVFLALRSVPAP